MMTLDRRDDAPARSSDELPARAIPNSVLRRISMGVLTRSLDDVFVITSDFDAANPKSKTAPKRLPTTYKVWTGRTWSDAATEAMKFPTLDEADDYVRHHFVEIMKRDAVG
jgi:hypothetical protein